MAPSENQGELRFLLKRVYCISMHPLHESLHGVAGMKEEVHKL
jgi:hypothetical protein